MSKIMYIEATMRRYGYDGRAYEYYVSPELGDAVRVFDTTGDRPRLMVVHDITEFELREVAA